MTQKPVLYAEEASILTTSNNVKNVQIIVPHAPIKQLAEHVIMDFLSTKANVYPAPN
jgi:hypothetical protein